MIQTAKELAAAALAVAEKQDTLYVLGCFGAPLNDKNKARYTGNLAYNKAAVRRAKILGAADNTFGFDCVCLIKGLLWGWCGDAAKTYGGAAYASNGVPDINADQMIAACSGVSADFSAIRVGEAVWVPGHIGIYVGDGLCVECTPKWKDGVQVTAVLNLGNKEGYHGRTWRKHGCLPYVSYADPAVKSVRVELPQLRRGDKGRAVRVMQALLMAQGVSCGESGADGSCGPATDAALRQFQSDKGLTVDGICGKATWTALLGGAA